MNYSRFLLIILSILVYVSFFSIVNAQENPVGFEMHRDLAAVLGAPLNETGPQMVWLPEESVFLAGTSLSINNGMPTWKVDSLGTLSTCFGQANRPYGFGSMIWGTGNYISKKTAYSTAFGDQNILLGFNRYSVAWGFNNIIHSSESTAFGERNVIGPDSRYSTIWGQNNDISNENVTAWGKENRAGGFASTVMGHGNIAKGYGGMVLGTYCDTINGMADQSIFSVNTPLLVVGNGLTNDARSNALSVFGSGMIKVGSGPASSDLHIKQSETEMDGGTGGIILEHDGAVDDYWQIYNSGSFLSFGKNGERIAYIGTNGSFVDDENFLPEKIPLVKFLQSSKEKILSVDIGKRAFSKSKSKVQINAVQFLEDYPEMIFYDEEGNPFGIDYKQLYLTALVALQEEIKTNDQQQKEINELKSTLSEIMTNLKKEN